MKLFSEVSVYSEFYHHIIYGNKTYTKQTIRNNITPPLRPKGGFKSICKYIIFSTALMVCTKIYIYCSVTCFGLAFIIKNENPKKSVLHNFFPKSISDFRFWTFFLSIFQNPKYFSTKKLAKSQVSP